MQSGMFCSKQIIGQLGIELVTNWLDNIVVLDSILISAYFMYCTIHMPSFRTNDDSTTDGMMLNSYTFSCTFFDAPCGKLLHGKLYSGFIQKLRLHDQAVD